MTEQQQWLPEWHAAKGIWLRWPYRSDIWPMAGDAAQGDILALLSTLNDTALELHLMVPKAALSAATEKLEATLGGSAAQRVQLHEVEYADIWLRDCAPFVCANGLHQHFGFDGWSGVDDQWQKDVDARDWLSQYLQAKVSAHDIVLEGGALYTDGEGTGLACAGGTLFRAANSEWSVKAFETELRERLGIERIHWLPGKFSADETGGHADNVASFLAPGVIAYAMAKPGHADYATCKRVERYLTEARDAKERAYQCVALPLPTPLRLSNSEATSIAARAGVRRRIAGMPLMASYLNFIRAGNLVVLPTFGIAEDQQALAIMQQALPHVDVRQSPARALLAGGGGLHCASWVEPELSSTASSE
ncbi:agmatine deiminase family protein [Aliidiomarina celeris]|uniref:agmatine deiminase family protein n=1 Tax=Aliidiomarina celeris TaxID=2249428 RepID=UPI000DE85706|nr:agmatine deiminase family protein [Aliidiomarina celeris]